MAVRATRRIAKLVLPEWQCYRIAITILCTLSSGSQHQRQSNCDDEYGRGGGFHDDDDDDDDDNDDDGDADGDCKGENDQEIVMLVQ